METTKFPGSIMLRCGARGEVHVFSSLDSAALTQCRDRFHVLPHEFVTHQWHAANKWAGSQRDEVKQKMLDAFNKFKEVSFCLLDSKFTSIF
jgi:hypothetical protein